MDTSPVITFLQQAAFDQRHDLFLIFHVDAGVILETRFLYEIPTIVDTQLTYPFIFENAKGGQETHVFIVYKTYKETSDMLQVFKDCEQWYIKFMRWEEDEIIRGKTNTD